MTVRVPERCCSSHDLVTVCRGQVKTDLLGHLSHQPMPFQISNCPVRGKRSEICIHISDRPERAPNDKSLDPLALQAGRLTPP